jgi:hypothetical protein
VMESVDGGLSWRRIRGPATKPCQTYVERGLVIGVEDEFVLHMGTRSLCPGEPVDVYTLPLDPTRSEGSTWSEGGSPGPVGELRLELVRGAAPTLYALTYSGLWTKGLPAQNISIQPETAPRGAHFSPLPAIEQRPIEQQPLTTPPPPTPSVASTPSAQGPGEENGIGPWPAILGAIALTFLGLWFTGVWPKRQNKRHRQNDEP